MRQNKISFKRDKRKITEKVNTKLESLSDKSILKHGRKKNMLNMEESSFVNGLKLGPKGTYIYRIKISGKVRTGDTAQTRLFEAEKELVKIRAAFLQDSLGIEKKKAPTFKRAVELFMDMRTGKRDATYLENMKQLLNVHFVIHIGHKTIDKLDKSEYEKCLLIYLEKTQAGKEIKTFGGYNKLIGHLHNVLECMVEGKYISRFELPNREKSQEKNYDVLKLEQVDLLFAASMKKYKLTRTVGLAMGCYLGLRASEITNAKWHNINWTDKQFINDKTKGKEAKPIPICNEMLSLFKQLKGEEEKIGYIMLTEDKKKYNRKFAEHMLKHLGTKLFKMHLTAHSLRRSFITILHNAGTAPKTLQNLARHSTLAQTMTYVKIGESEKQLAIDEVFNKKSSRAV